MTSRVISQVLMLFASTHSFKNVATQVNLSSNTVVRIFDHLLYTPSNLPRVLSFDEFKGNTGHEKYQITGLLNSLETSFTNGFNEGINNKFKVLKQNAYGYRNFNRFRNASFI